MSALEATLRERARREEWERCKRGLADLMAFHADGLVIDVEWQEGEAPWLLVKMWWLDDLTDRTEEFAILEDDRQRLPSSHGRCRGRAVHPDDPV